MKINIINCYNICFRIHYMIKTRLSNNVFSYCDSLNNIGINENKQLMSPSSKNIVTKYITFDELCPI